MGIVPWLLPIPSRQYRIDYNDKSAFGKRPDNIPGNGEQWSTSCQSSCGPGLSEYEYKLNADGLRVLIGEGAFGFVFRGTHIPTNTECAIKQAKSDDSPRSEGSYLVLAAKLEVSPNLIHFHEEDGMITIIMEVCPGRSLKDQLDVEGSLAEEEVRKVAKGLLACCSSCHKSGFVHGDVKPAHLFYSEETGIRVVDFGSAATLYENGAHVETFTEYYAAPEVKNGEPYTMKSEAWSVGVTLKDLLGDADCTPQTKELLRDLCCQDVKQRLSCQEALEKHFTDTNPLDEPRHVCVA